MFKSIVFILICFFTHELLAQSNYVLRESVGKTGSVSTFQLGDKKIVVESIVGQQTPINQFENQQLFFFEGYINPIVLKDVVTKGLAVQLDLVSFPNPFKDVLKVALNVVPENTVEVAVYDNLGVLVYNESCPPKRQIQVSMKDLPSGIYIVKIVANNKQSVSTVLKL